MVLRLQYKTYLKSKAWQRKRSAIKAQTGNKCALCGKPAPLHAHHKTYAHLGYEQDGELVGLCASCHAREHEIYGEDDMIDFNTRNPVPRLEHLIDTVMQTKNAKETPRDYLGASRIGESCLRKLQYEYFNTPKDTPFSGKTLRIFHRGHEGEEWMIHWMRAAGFDLRTEKPDGSQYGFVTANGKIQGHVDGVFVAGIDDFAPYPRLWENKVLGAKGFGKLQKDRLKKAYPVYYAQIQLYMAYMDLADNPALFTALNANDMEIYAESVAFDAAYAQEMSDKAVRVVTACMAGDLLPRVATREDWYECKYCDYRERCWHG